MENHKTALITGASKGLGYALAEYLGTQGWNLVITARNARQLLKAKRELENLTNVIAVSGDVRDEVHLLELAEILKNRNWEVDLLVNNASTLGLSPLKPLLEHPVENLHIVFHTNVIAPISLLQRLKEVLAEKAQIVNISSDAAIEAYENWAAYGSSKAAMDHITQILAKENPEWKFYAFDPGDMRTDMHQAAFPFEDISDRPLPAAFAVPGLVQLIQGEFKSGRYSVESFKKAEV